MPDKKKKIVFWPDVYKEQGHWLPTLAWAEYLKDDFDISFMGILDCKQIVDDYNRQNNTNFFYYPIFTKTYPMGYTSQIQASTNERWKPDHVKSLMYAMFYHNDDREDAGANENQIEEATEIRYFLTEDCDDGFPEYFENFDDDYQNEIKEKVKQYGNPDLIVSGYFTAMETAILYHLNQRGDDFSRNILFAISTTYLRHPSEDPAVRVMQNLQAFNNMEQRYLLNIIMTDPDDFDEDELEKEPSSSIDDFVLPLADMHEFIPCTKTFDYAQYEHGAKVHYVEPCITNELGEPDELSAKIDWNTLLTTNKKIVFVTAGSQILDYKEKALVLFQSIIDAMQASDMKEYHLILCAGGTLAQSLKSNYDNVTICGWVPQRQILLTLAQEDHKGSCAIIHGGLATIKECVYCNVPFLVLPLGKDQMDNALRLEDCGINNYFYIEFIKPKCLLYFINQILQDYVSLSNLAALSKEFHDAENSHIGARAIAYLAENGNLDNFDWDAV